MIILFDVKDSNGNNMDKYDDSYFKLALYGFNTSHSDPGASTLIKSFCELEIKILSFLFQQILYIISPIKIALELPGLLSSPKQLMNKIKQIIKDILKLIIDVKELFSETSNWFFNKLFEPIDNINIPLSDFSLNILGIGIGIPLLDKKGLFETNVYHENLDDNNVIIKKKRLKVLKKELNLIKDQSKLNNIEFQNSLLAMIVAVTEIVVIMLWEKTDDCFLVLEKIQKEVDKKEKLTKYFLSNKISVISLLNNVLDSSKNDITNIINPIQFQDIEVNGFNYFIIYNNNINNFGTGVRTCNAIINFNKNLIENIKSNDIFDNEIYINRKTKILININKDNESILNLIKNINLKRIEYENKTKNINNIKGQQKNIKKYFDSLNIQLNIFIRNNINIINELISINTYEINQIELSINKFPIINERNLKYYNIYKNNIYSFTIVRRILKKFNGNPLELKNDIESLAELIDDEEQSIEEIINYYLLRRNLTFKHDVDIIDKNISDLYLGYNIFKKELDELQNEYDSNKKLEEDTKKSFRPSALTNTMNQQKEIKKEILGLEKEISDISPASVYKEHSTDLMIGVITAPIDIFIGILLKLMQGVTEFLNQLPLPTFSKLKDFFKSILNLPNVSELEILIIGMIIDIVVDLDKNNPTLINAMKIIPLIMVTVITNFIETILKPLPIPI
jgi:Sec-independent protein translocase protein TatA